MIPSKQAHVGIVKAVKRINPEALHGAYPKSLKRPFFSGFESGLRWLLC